MDKEIVSQPKISALLSCNKNFILEDDIITIKAVINNKSSIEVGNCDGGKLKVFSMFPEEINFIPDSLRINGINIKNESIISEITLDSLKANEAIELEFDALVVGEKVKDIEFNINLMYGYIEDNEIFYEMIESNFIHLKLEVAKAELVKKYSETYLSLNDVVECEVEILNVGSLEIVNIVYKDDVSNMFQLIENSFSVNDEILSSCNIDKGIYVGNLPMKEKLLIKYKIKLIASSYKSHIESKSEIEYSFILPNKILRGQKKRVFKDKSNIFYLNISNFKQLNIENYLTISDGYKLIKDINKIDVDVKITNLYVIETSKKKSYEGQVLSGYKLIVNGKINEVVEYTSCSKDSAVHTENLSCPFGTFIILPQDFKLDRKIEIESVVEHINYKVIDNKSFYQDISLLLYAKICN